VRVVSDFWGGPIGEAVGDGDELVDVPLLFLLVAGDRLHLETIECGLFHALPERTGVSSPPDFLSSPELDEPLDDCGGRIAVRQLAPGAVLDIERVSDLTTPDDIATLLASVPVTRTESMVAVPPLEPGSLIRVRQRLRVISRARRAGIEEMFVKPASSRDVDAGGAASPLTNLDSSRQECLHSAPSFLPDGSQSRI
jgi:hypothetical protein